MSSLVIRAHQDPGMSPRLPSVMNLFSIFSQPQEEWENFEYATATGDSEGKENACVRLIEHPFFTGHSVLTAINLGSRAIQVIKNSSFLLNFQANAAALAPIFGFPLVAIELIFASCQLKKIHDFERPLLSSYVPLDKDPAQRLEALQKNWGKVKNLLKEDDQKKILMLFEEKKADEVANFVIQRDLAYLKKQYLNGEDATEQDNNLKKLSRRVQPWLAREMSKEIPFLLKAKDPVLKAEAMRRGKELLLNVQTQVLKKKISHVISIVAMTLIASGLILGLLPFTPVMIPTILALIGSAISISHYLHTQGYWNSRGWNFSVLNCVPDFLKNLWKKLKSTETEAKTEDTCIPLQIVPKPLPSSHNGSPPRGDRHHKRLDCFHPSPTSSPRSYDLARNR